MKILLLSHSFSPVIGGIEVISEFLATAFTRSGHEVHVVTTSAAPSADLFPFTVIRNPDNKKLLREHSWADIVFENNPCLRLSWPAIFFRKPLIVSLHTWIADPQGRIRIQDRLKHLWLRKASRVIACSDAIRKKCWSAATVIHNPYNEAIFKNQQLEKNRDFVFLGRLVSDKGADMAVTAVQQLVEQEQKDFTLTVIGNGPDKEQLQQLATTAGAVANIVFDGMLTGAALAQRLNQHRFILIPSRWEEPFGLVALEGMACGCVPIVSDGGGLPEAVGNAGIVFKRGDVADMVKCLRTIISNPDLEKELVAKGFAHLPAHHPDIVAKKYLQIIQELMPGKYSLPATKAAGVYK